MKNLCFVDIETTGTEFNYHEIIDIGVIKTSLDGEKILAKLEKKIQPKFPKRITKTAKEINNYNSEDWKNAKAHSIELWNTLIKFWKNCIPVCHNPSFERAFITISALSHQIKDIKLDYHWIGTESLAWYLYLNGKIPKLSLSSIADYYCIEPEPYPHTAINGAKQCRDVYRKLIKHVHQRPS